jgi:hypothetical protein
LAYAVLDASGNAGPDAEMVLVLGVGRGLDELDEHPAGVLGMDEVDP